MTTVTAKQLRENLSEIMRRSMAGEKFEVIYRSRPAVKILPARPVPKAHTGEANRKLLEDLLANHPVVPNPRWKGMSYKQIRDRMMREDPKYGKYFTE